MLFLKNKINNNDILWWWRELALLLRHGISLPNALTLLAKNNGKNTLDALFQAISDQVAGGATLATALAQHPKHFNQTTRTIIAMGENMEQLIRASEAVSILLTTCHHQTTSFKRQLRHPMVMLCLFFVLIVLFGHLILPNFALLYAGFGSDLPALTLFIMSITSWVIDYLWLNVAAVGCVVWLWFHHAAFHDYLSVRIPSVASLIRAHSLLELFALLSFLPNDNKTIAKQAFESMAVGISNVDHRQSLMNAYSVEDPSLASIARKTPWIPKNVCKMIEVGNEINTLSCVLESLAKHCFIDYPPNNALASMIKVFIFIMVALFVVAMYLPIFSMAGLF